MHKSIRIRTTPNSEDKYVQIKLTQTFDFLEILSLKLTQAEVYRKFAADYGVIVGRVIANRGFGVPNAKVSIFIPLDDEETDSELIGRYPFKSPLDLDNNGVRYNLLEDTNQGNCHKSVGTFPNKRKMLDNGVWLEIYDKYYKFTTVTNQAGDYMIYGVPTGNQRIHMDVDVSNIGFVSLKPYELINQGYSPNLFESNTTFKGGTDLDTLVQIQKRDYTVNVLPFWGDLVENEIGINRVDFNLGVDITPTSLFFGSIFTHSKDEAIHKLCVPRAFVGANCGFQTGVGSLEIIRRINTISNEVELIQSNSTKIDEYGNWAVTVPMNLDTVITDEFGNLIPSEDPNVGVPTRARCRFRMAIDEFKFGFAQRTAHYLVPNLYNRYSFGSNTIDDDMVDLRWKKIYTVTNYVPRYQVDDPISVLAGYDDSPFHTGIKFIGTCEGKTPFPFNRVDANLNPLYSVLCVIITAVGAIIEMINTILRVIIFEVVLVFVCFLQHIFEPEKRGSCRCRSCVNLSSGLDEGSTDLIAPPDWSFPEDRYYCAACYQYGESDAFALKITPYEMVGSVTQDPLGGINVTGQFVVHNNIDYTVSNGFGADFIVDIAAGLVTSLQSTFGGEQFMAGDVITIPMAEFIGAAQDLIITVNSVDLQTSVEIDGNSIDCSGFTYDVCEDLCYQCQVSIIPLDCNGVEYNDGNDWADCVKEQLAEDLGVIVYEFYNDWVIGSLYCPMFEYTRSTSIENFCDYDCRPPFDVADPNDIHRDNLCTLSRIVDKRLFNGGNYDVKGLYSNLLNPDGSGIIAETSGFLYYSARNDIGTNPIGIVSDLGVLNISGDGKENLMFATNVIELGSSLTCDLDGEPYLVNNLVSSSYQKENGVKTLYDVTNCDVDIFAPNSVNIEGIVLLSQVGVEVLVAETEDNSPSPTIGASDGLTYTIVGDRTQFPDYGSNSHAVLIINRNDTILRRHLCENFPYFNTIGSYSKTFHPIFTPLTGTISTSDGINIVGSLIPSTNFVVDFPIISIGFFGHIIIDGQARKVIDVTSATTLEVDNGTPFVPFFSNEIYGNLALTPSDYLYNSNGAVQSYTDTCAGFDDLIDVSGATVAENMPPYYMYFGMNLGNTALDKLRRTYFDKCVG
jgi:hypothetical protein